MEVAVGCEIQSRKKEEVRGRRNVHRFQETTMCMRREVLLGN